jgi:hypothetical protein
MNVDASNAAFLSLAKSMQGATSPLTSFNPTPMDDTKIYSCRYVRTEIMTLSRYLGTGINALAFTGDTFMTSLMLILRQKKRVALSKNATASDSQKIKMEIFQHMVNVSKFDDIEDLRMLGRMLKIKESVIAREADFDLPQLDLEGL